MFGDAPMQRTKAQFSQSKHFVCARTTLSKRYKRYEAHFGRTWIVGRTFYLHIDILQGSDYLQASETSECLVHRRRGPEFIYLLHGISVDGSWGHTRACKEAPGS